MEVDLGVVRRPMSVSSPSSSNGNSQNSHRAFRRLREAALLACNSAIRDRPTAPRPPGRDESAVNTVNTVNTMYSKSTEGRKVYRMLCSGTPAVHPSCRIRNAEARTFTNSSDPRRQPSAFSSRPLRFPPGLPPWRRISTLNRSDHRQRSQASVIPGRSAI